MTNIISLIVVILGCVLLTRAEPPVTRYSITGDNSGYEFNSNVIGGAYVPGKDSHRENTDFYGGGSSGHSLSAGRTQGNLEESLRQNSFNGFSPSSHHSTFQSTSPYFMNDATQSSFESYMNSNNGDSSFDGYTQSADQVGSDFSQFSSSKHKGSMFTRYSDSLPGASNAGSFSDIVPEGSSFREFSGDGFKSHLSGGYMDSDQSFNRDPLLFSGSAGDYTFGKHKESILGTGNSNKFMSDVFSPHSETRFMRGNHGSMVREYGSPSYSSNSGSSHFSSLRGSSGLYSPGKYSKYNKYMSDYTPNAAMNYLSKDQDIDYLFGNYGKGGKIAAFKDSRPNSYNGQAYFGGPSYMNKISGSYKGKLGYVNYSNSPPMGYSSMAGLHGSGNGYADGPMLRRYRSSSGHGGMYSGYF